MFPKRFASLSYSKEIRTAIQDPRGRGGIAPTYILNLCTRRG
jgi:hypothetical protein